MKDKVARTASPEDVDAHLKIKVDVSLKGKPEIEPHKSEELDFKAMGLKEIGEFDKCPSCSSELEKVPKRKKKCESCGNYIFVRTRPLDRKKVLVTEEQAEQIEQEWARYYEIKEEDELSKDTEYQTAKKDLTKRFGFEPSRNDVKWAVLNNRTLDAISKRQWGLYRNVKREMAEILNGEEKKEKALAAYFEVCFSDLNDCVEGLPFDPKIASLAPAVIYEVRELISDLHLSEEKAKEFFISVTAKTQPFNKTYRSPEESWSVIRKGLNSG